MIFVDYDGVLESVVGNNIWIGELIVSEGGLVELLNFKSGWELEFKGYLIICVEFGSFDEVFVLSFVYDLLVGFIVVDDFILFDEDIKSEIIIVGKDYGLFFFGF